MAIELAKAETQLVLYDRNNEIVKVIHTPIPPRDAALYPHHANTLPLSGYKTGKKFGE
jgi:hypothetical protein